MSGKVCVPNRNARGDRLRLSGGSPATGARLLLMDEPSMGLSPALVQQNFRIIKEVHEPGVEAVQRAARAVRELARVLKPGGRS